MASTYSPKLRFELIGAGEQAGLWGTTTNKNVGQLIEQAIAGVTTVNLDGVSGNYTLTALDGAPDQSRSAVILCTYNAVPASGAINLIVPTQTKLYVVRNDCGQTITVKTSAQVGGVQLLNSEATLVFCDGTDAVLGLESAAAGTLPVSAGGTGATTFSAGFVKSPGGTGSLTSSSSVSLTADVSGTLPVGSGGTGVTSVTSGRIVLGNGSGPLTVLSGTVDGQVATWSAALSAWVALPPGTAGVSSFNTRTGGVIPLVGDYSSFYYPLSSNPSGYLTSGSAGALYYPLSGNPSGFITSSSLSGYAQLGGANSWSNTNTFGTGTTFNGIVGVNNTMTINAGSGGGIVSANYNFTSLNESIFGSSGLVSISVGGSARIDVTTSEFTPDGDNNMNLGSASKRWIQVYAVSGSINTSDANSKQDIADLDDAEKRVAARLKGLIKKFRFKDAVAEKGAGARIHVGVIAQEVRDAFTAEGLDAHRYGLFCSDTWWEREEEVKYLPTGEMRMKTVIYETPVEGATEVTQLGVRYDELLAFVIAAI